MRTSRARRARAAHHATLRFGIYPGGPAGTVGPGATPRPADPAKRLAALKELRGDHPFVLHLYASYTGPAGATAVEQAGQEIAQYAEAGFEVELVLCYRPADGGSREQVAGFARFVADAVSSLAANPRLVSLQVTNEANVGGAPNASDGYYADAKDALIAGVIAAAHEARATGHSHLAVGFNWAYATDPGEVSFWAYLHRHGGRAFTRAVDWVGLDAYPGTWGPRLDPGHLGQATGAMMRTALHTLRSHYLPLAGIGHHVPLHISENGYPTGPDRTPAMQVTVMRDAVATIHALRTRYNISDYRWFDLRDADSASPSFEDRYGLLYDDYAPKPAFDVYRELVARYSTSR